MYITLGLILRGEKNLRMSGSHTADLFFLFKCLAELFAADIITDYAGRKKAGVQ